MTATLRAMRTEFTVGHLADPANTTAEFPTLEYVLDESRRMEIWGGDAGATPASTAAIRTARSA